VGALHPPLFLVATMIEVVDGVAGQAAFCLTVKLCSSVKASHDHAKSAA
jgi:hypothetical protein